MELFDDLCGGLKFRGLSDERPLKCGCPKAQVRKNPAQFQDLVALALPETDIKVVFLRDGTPYETLIRVGEADFQPPAQPPTRQPSPQPAALTL